MRFRTSVGGVAAGSSHSWAVWLPRRFSTCLPAVGAVSYELHHTAAAHPAAAALHFVQPALRCMRVPQVATECTEPVTLKFKWAHPVDVKDGVHLQQRKEGRGERISGGPKRQAGADPLRQPPLQCKRQLALLVQAAAWAAGASSSSRLTHISQLPQQPVCAASAANLTADMGTGSAPCS